MSLLRGRPTAALVLSAIIAALAAVAAAAGRLVPGLYRDNRFVTAGWAGNDTVTLFVAVPALVVALALAARGSARGQLAWLGLLDYMLYNFAFYLFGSALNRIFLLYAAIFALSVLALLFALVRVDTRVLRERGRPRPWTRAVAAYIALVAVMLAAVEIGQVVAFARTGVLPAVVALTGHPTHVVAALDLTLVVPFALLGAAWLWAGAPWGYVLSAIFTVKGAVYMAALAATSLAVARAGFPAAAAEAPLWATLGAGNLLSTLILLWNFRRPPGYSY